MNQERQRRLKGGNIVPGVVPGFPTGPLYLISSSDELLIIISGSRLFSPPSPSLVRVRGFHEMTRR